jgi:hypothetical protein
MEFAMTDIPELVDRYLQVWNETDPARRRALIANTWTEDASYLDPVLCGQGHDGIDAMVEAVHARYPGLTFARAGQIDQHNDRVRFGWTFGSEHGPALARGIDIAVVAPDGRFAQVTGFFDEVRQAA